MKVSLRPLRTGELLYALGNVRHAQGKLDDSLTYYTRALKIFKLTDEHGPSIAKTHYKLGVHYMRADDLDKAGYTSPFLEN